MPRQERAKSGTGIYHVMLGMKNNGTFGAIDNLTITYDGNRLVKVTDAAEALNYDGALDFHDGDDSTCEYDYDSNGALTRDSNRGINSITYDYGHHTYKIDLDLNNRPRNILNDYTSDGRKLLSKHVISIPKVNGYTKKTITDKYVDGLMLRGDTTLLWRFDGGYVELNANGTPTRWNYYIADHLGSTRMVVDSNDSIRETINYYPFGSEMRMSNPAQMSGNTSHPFRFTGKELDRQNSLNMYDFGARMFDVAGVPMWTSVDPLAEKYYNISPYAYCAGNPVMIVDPDGRRIEFAKGVSQAFKDNFAKAIQYLKNNKCDGIFSKLQALKNTVIYIGEATTQQKANNGACFTPDDMTIHWDPSMGILTTNYHILSPTTLLNHEADHALKYASNPEAFWKDYNTPDNQYSNKLERDCIQGTEQKTARSLGEIGDGEVTRTDHKMLQIVSTPDPTETDVIVTGNKKKKTNDENIINTCNNVPSSFNC